MAVAATTAIAMPAPTTTGTGLTLAARIATDRRTPGRTIGRSRPLDEDLDIGRDGTALRGPDGKIPSRPRQG